MKTIPSSNLQSSFNSLSSCYDAWLLDTHKVQYSVNFQMVEGT